MHKLLEFFKEDNGSYSSTRLISLLVYTCTLSVWTYLSMHKGEMVDIHPTMLVLFGVLAAQKVTQKFAEKK